ncbi:hypothetical protein D3C87_189170 [compost metagenome]
MTKLLLALSLVMFSFSSVSMAKSKVSKKDMKAFQAACKEENPGATKKELKKCAKAKARG